MVRVERPAWAGPEIDADRPSAARIYDAHLGGFHNFQADRDAAAKIVAFMPELPDIMRANRSFLRRAVRYLVGQGITQFLDLGSGIPTVGNVHEIAWKANPDCRIVYVDVDPVAVSHSRTILRGIDHATAIQGDLRRPQEILSNPEVQRLLDFGQPIAVLMFAVLHFVPDTDDPVGIIRSYLDATVPGSYLAISHASLEGPEPEKAEEATEQFRRSVTEFSMRTRSEITGLFDGLELVDPGVVYLPEWQPDPGDEIGDPRRTSTFAGVARTLR
ncbi:SAM-dependent methyltransferase [Lentzea sp. BCCO 10_0856]|uniref:SAM-dependent methyltransferase n=1 Tax=Lentzea miocenica TaxID=3095431 RepID=A0ABU4TGB7_9PSEU|nr:SAM-dependent methyltransferase [Lentzea sp. BCCO 10_0856]MDX8037213.1 SAM-dependent methyltransferase [Lentzea sp. BCCO 10_0856]